MRALLDTNIVYDILCKRPFDGAGLKSLLAMHAFGDVELWVSAKSYTDLFYLIRKELGNDGAQDLLEDTLSWLEACSVEKPDVERALQDRWPDFEDSLVNICAEKVKADYIVTRDVKGFSRAKIPHGAASDFMDFVFERTKTRYAVQEAG